MHVTRAANEVQGDINKHGTIINPAATHQNQPGKKRKVYRQGQVSHVPVKEETEVSSAGDVT